MTFPLIALADSFLLECSAVYIYKMYSSSTAAFPPPPASINASNPLFLFIVHHQRWLSQITRIYSLVVSSLRAPHCPMRLHPGQRSTSVRVEEACPASTRSQRFLTFLRSLCLHPLLLESLNPLQPPVMTGPSTSPSRRSATPLNTARSCLSIWRNLNHCDL